MPRARLLVVEDQSIIALDLKNRLNSLGYDVLATAAYAETALQQAAADRPDLVLMDIRLKGEMDGIQAAERLRADHDLPVIYLTAHSDEQTLQRAKLTAPYGYVLKPFEDRELHMAIEIALHKHNLEAQLKERERWLAATLTSIGDAVIATDRAGRVKFMNPVAEALTGWTQAEAIGQALSQIVSLVDEETRAPAIGPVAQVWQAGAGIGLANHTVLIARDGQEVPIEASAAPIQAERGQPGGLVLVFRDVTERRRAAEALRASNAELARLLAQAKELAAAAQQASRLKDEILTHTSHELRTPLTAIMGALDIVLGDLYTSEAERQAFVRAARDAADKLLGLVNNLLDLAKLEAGQMPLRREAVDLEQLLGEAQALMRGPAERKGLALEIRRPANPLPPCFTDGEHLRRILLNVLDNAIKFTAEGRITVMVHEAASSPAEGGARRHVQIAVQDTGIGIPLEVQGRLFQPFVQADGGTTRRYGGTGLGLSISRRLAQILGGTLTLASAGEGRGATVTLQLPLT